MHRYDPWTLGRVFRLVETAEWLRRMDRETASIDHREIDIDYRSLEDAMAITSGEEVKR